tara:strand:- start:2718 stop:3134 length:417 start_codon:yes stop_codon:yes gene_type:complete
MINNLNMAYVAGLFDGEGSIQYKQYMRKRKHNIKPYPTWSIRMEIAMTEKAPLVFVMETLGCGTVNSRKVRPGRKKQWRWRCCHQDAYYSALLLQPYAHVKIQKLNKIIEHYTNRKNMFKFDDKIVRLEDFKRNNELG